METTDTFTYETEVLPEIEIRELVSFDELLASLPSFVAFTEDEILHYLTQLVEDKHKGSVFNQLYHSVRRAKTTPLDHVVPILSTRVSDVTDEMLMEILENIDETRRAPNYQTQMDEIAKLTYPLEKTNGTFVPALSMIVSLEQDVKKRFVLLPKDTVPQQLYGVAIRIPSATSESFVHERANVRQLPSFPSTSDILVGKSPEDASLDFPSVIDRITRLIDVHGLRVHLSQHGYSFDTLTEDQMAVLLTKLKNLVENDNEPVTEELQTSEDTTTSKRHIDLWSAVLQAIERPIDKDRYASAMQVLAANTQLLTPSITIPKDVVELARGLSENKYTLEEVITVLKYERSLAEYQTLRDFVEHIQDTDPEKVAELLEEAKQKWAMINNKYIDRVNDMFVESYKDMAEIKEGRRDDKYMGDDDTVIFEEQANNPSRNVEDGEDDLEIAAEELTPENLAIQDVSFQGVSSGCKEVLDIILPQMAKMKNVSGLPLDLQALIHFVSSNVVRITRADYLQSAVPQLAVHMRNQLLTMDLERALHMSMFITPTYIIPNLKEALKTSWASLESDTRDVFVMSIGWWCLELQQKALNRELVFDTMRGFLPCIRKFSPWGPPIQNDKGEGVLEYVACVAKESGIWTQATEDLKQRVIRTWEGDVRVEELKAKYKELGKAVLSMNERAKAANLSLAEAIENKQKQRYLPEYVKAYMLLPGLLASHQPKVNYGCCLQKIGENFKADSDWRGILKRVGNVKDAFAKKRMTMAEMPSYVLFDKQEDGLVIEDMVNVEKAVQLDPPQTFPLQTWMQEWSGLNVSFITPDMIQTVYTDMNKALSTCEKFLQMAAATASTRMTYSTFIKETASWSHYDQMLNVVLTSLHRDSRTYTDGVEKETLATAMDELIRVKQHMHKLRGYFDDVEFSLIRPMYAYIISRAVCLPAVPETSKSQRLVLVGTFNAQFLAKTVKSTLDSLRQFVNMKHMPTLEQQKEFITNAREQQKVESLELLDKKTVDDRQLLLDAKKLGLVTLSKKPVGLTLEQEEEAAARDEEQEGIQEFRYHGADQDDMNMDALNDE